MDVSYKIFKDGKEIQSYSCMEDPDKKIYGPLVRCWFNTPRCKGSVLEIICKEINIKLIFTQDGKQIIKPLQQGLIDEIMSFFSKECDVNIVKITKGEDELMKCELDSYGELNFNYLDEKSELKESKIPFITRENLLQFVEIKSVVCLSPSNYRYLTPKEHEKFDELLKPWVGTRCCCEYKMVMANLGGIFFENFRIRRMSKFHLFLGEEAGDLERKLLPIFVKDKYQADYQLLQVIEIENNRPIVNAAVEDGKVKLFSDFNGTLKRLVSVESVIQESI